MSSVAYYNRDSIFAVGQHNLYRSDDAGATWYKVTIPDSLTPQNLRSITMLTAYGTISNPRAVVMCGDSGLIVRSIDRGRTWKRITGNLNPAFANKVNLHDVFMVYNQGSQFACGDTIILRGTSFGSSWTAMPLPRREIYNSIKFISGGEGRVVGSNGTILYTSTGGQGNLWLPETTNVTTTLNGLSYINGNYPDGSLWQRAWAVGENGTILVADGAGPTTWKKLPSGTTTNLRNVNFVDTLRGFAFGDGGLILYTTNGGDTWKSIQSGTTANIACASFLPPLYRIQNYYALELYGERRQIFTDFSDVTNITELSFNRDYYVQPKPDTAKISLDPLYFYDPLHTYLFRFSPVSFNLAADPGGFIVVYNDKAKFRDHYKLPPEADSHEINFDITRDSSEFWSEFTLIGTGYTPKFYKWKLLPSSEIRLKKIYVKQLNQPPLYPPVDFPPPKTIDVMRFGGYHLATDYAQNKPAPSLPEYWSLARYQDLVTTDLNTISSDKYYYLTEKPLPGWISQLRSH